MVITWSAQSDGTVNWGLTGSVDANFANCQMTRKSHGGLDQLSQSGPSILEKRTATGTEPTLIWQDNKACILLSKNESSSAGRCKHIDTKIRSVAEAISDGVVKIRYTPSSYNYLYNYADILTKLLGEVMFHRMIDGLHSILS